MYFQKVAYGTRKENLMTAFETYKVNSYITEFTFALLCDSAENIWILNVEAKLILIIKG